MPYSIDPGQHLPLERWPPMPAIPEGGGPAFPQPLDSTYYNGMSLRDYFAAAALTGYVTGSLTEVGAETLVSSSNQAQETPSQFMCNACYQIADKMLKAREVGGS